MLKTPETPDYVDASLNEVIDLAKSVVEGGGRLPVPEAANAIRRSPRSSRFTSIHNAATKLGLVSKEKDMFRETDRGKQVALTVDEGEKVVQCRRVFLSVPLYAAIAERFSGRKAPEESKDSKRLSSLLALEYKLPTKVAQRVAPRFIEEARRFGIMDEGRNVIPSALRGLENGDKDPSEGRKDEALKPGASEDPPNGGEDGAKGQDRIKQAPPPPPKEPSNPEGFSFQILAPDGKGYRGSVDKKGYFALLKLAMEKEAEFEGEDSAIG